MDLLVIFSILISIITIFYWYLTKTYNHWSKQKIPCLPSRPFPGFGHILPIITLRQSLHDFSLKAYHASEASVIGFYFTRKPAIFVRDPELVKSVLVTNFSSFRNNAIQFNKELDPVMANHPFFTGNPDTWKVSRARAVNHLSNRKLGQHFNIINQVCSKMDLHLSQKFEEKFMVECELKDLFSKYTSEIVANAAFGIEGQSFEDNPDKWAFVSVTKTIFEPKLTNNLRQMLIFYLPEVANLLRLRFLQESTDEYLRESLKNILKQRKLMDIAPNDFLQFCIETNVENDVDKIIADIITFYFDVYETSSTALATVFYHLSKNQNIQEKLREHITSVMEKFEGEITYEALKEMNYLEQIIYESMRLTPPFPTLFKTCTQEITLKGSDGLECHLTEGNVVLIPLIALNHDEKYWHQSQTFDPDRFSAENRMNQTKFVFLPFGEGPRQCIGLRLGLMLMKLATVRLIQNYSVEPSNVTREPLKMEPSSFMTFIEGGLWAKFKRLDQNG
ncbi:hypothetical protein QAD02_015925 [Eretmocerus hayati]|uniref:Uncharacterized protein n=1 Tax=Eretmocerus hayati TaxID=131215 RepID=A0ACC2P9M0_9HYME|nr:hypothetical protein QAD02_015925 [Eretmocerus hayati]